MKLDGRVAVVTGGGSGIGEAIARALNAEGARVAVLDRVEMGARLTAESLEPPGLPLTVDVADAAAVDRAFATVEAELGPVDILVNNAGIRGEANVERVLPRMEAQIGEAMSQGRMTTPLNSLVEMTDQEWREMFAIHVDGTFHCSRAALRSMGPRGRGCIVNIASICGMEGCTGIPHYSAAKGAILGLTRALAKEVILQGIRVNAIAPGYIDTPLLDVFSPLMRGFIAMQTPAQRLGRPGEVAAVAVFLASDDAGFMVGETVSPNGGMVTV